LGLLNAAMISRASTAIPANALTCERPSMPRLKAPAPDAESRKALEQRAREAALPAPPKQKGRWPFPVTDDQPAGEAEGNKDGSPEKPARPDKF
jgi:hypothetical protein